MRICVTQDRRFTCAEIPFDYGYMRRYRGDWCRFFKQKTPGWIMLGPDVYLIHHCLGY